MSTFSQPQTLAEFSPFNVFQQLVRHWDRLHPYNGAHAMQVSGALDLSAVRRAWHGAIDALGLGAVRLQQFSYRHAVLNGEASTHTVELCPVGTSLEQWFSIQMNEPFDPDGGVPFRPFALVDGDTYWLGLSYQHWIADSAAIRILMHEWFTRLYDPAGASIRPLTTAGRGYFSLFGPHRAGWHAGQAILSTLRWQSGLRTARRIEDPAAFQDLTQRVRMFSAPDGLIQRLRPAARLRGATVNDVFLTAIAQACDRHVPAQRRFRRQHLAVGNIVDLRPVNRQTLGHAFDLLLGFTSVLCPKRRLGDWDQLLATVVSQSRQQKRHNEAHASWMRIGLGLAAHKMLTPTDVVEFYRKRIALAGACSNVNLNGGWASQYHPGPLLRYVRAAPTGPVTPLVLATTTLGSSFHLGLTYRPAIISDAQAADVANCFFTRLCDFAGA